MGLNLSGSRLEGYLGNRPDMGKVAQHGAASAAAGRIAPIRMAGQAFANKHLSDAKAEAQKVTNAAQDSARRDASAGQMFAMGGQLLGAGMGLLPKTGGGSFNTAPLGENFNLDEVSKLYNSPDIDIDWFGNY